jgi:hypothetical protein
MSSDDVRPRDSDPGSFTVLPRRRLRTYSSQKRTLPRDYALRRLDTVVATPHIGYVSRDLYRVLYQDTVANIAEWLLALRRVVRAETPVAISDQPPGAIKPSNAIK